MDNNNRPTKQEIDAMLAPIDFGADVPAIEMNDVDKLIMSLRMIDDMSESQLRQVEMRIAIRRRALGGQ